MSLKHRIGLFLSVFVLVSCANINTVKSAPKDTGIYENFTEDYELVKAAVLASMQSLNINIKETNETDEGFVITFTKAISAFSWGEVGRVIVAKREYGASKVFIHSQKRSKLQITGTEEREFAYSIFNGARLVLGKG